MKSLFFVVFLLLFSFILPAQTMLLPVPYHSQGSPWFTPGPGYPPSPNNWCTVACLHMLFDYYDHMGNDTISLPARQIASVCNTDDIGGVTGGHAGTYISDARRAAHFSMLSTSADGNVSNGYSWRKIGYSVVYSDTLLPPPYIQDFLNPGTIGLVGWMEVLNEGYPVIFNGHLPWFQGPPEGAAGSDLPEQTVVGHSILLVGYSLNFGNPLLSRLYFHDPWYGPYVYYTIAQLQAGPLVDYLFASPWEVKINAPDSVTIDTSTFDISASVRYSAPTLEYVQPNGPALQQQFPVAAYPIAVLQVDSCSLPIDIINPVDTLYLIRTTQSSYVSQWSATPGISGVNGSFRVKAVGLLQPTSSESYPTYQDTIGCIVTGGCTYSYESGSGVRLPETNSYKTRLSPNPFIESNSIALSLPEAGKVKISIFDELGREVKVLADENLEGGQHTITWDGTGKEGKPMPAGKYFYSISVDGKKISGEKAVLLK